MNLFPCPKCNKIFNRKFNLDTHLNKKFDCGKIENEIPNISSEIPNIPIEIPNIPITENTEKNTLRYN